MRSSGKFQSFYFLFFLQKDFVKNKQISDFLPLDVFYAHKNADFFVFVWL